MMAARQREALEQVKKNDLLKLVEAAPEFWAQAGVTLKPIEGLHRPEFKVRAMREGKEIPVFMPKPLLAAFEQMTPTESDMLTEGVMSYFRMVANMRRVTALLTPTFAVNQVIRDQPDSAIWAAEVGYRPYIEAARGMVHMLTGSPEAKRFRAFGGGMGSIASLDIETAPDMLSDVALRAREEDIKSTAMHAAHALLRFSRTWVKQEIVGADVEHKLSGVFYPMARLLETLDTATRMGAYLRALDKGRSEAEALAISRRSATDFALGGEVTANWTQAIPFMGAQAQAFALNREAVKRAGRESEKASAVARAAKKGWTITQATALQAGAAALMPLMYMVFLPELVHWAIHADDEEFHTTREQWEKEKYYFWAQLDDGEWLKTPRPLGYLSRIFGYAVGQALDEAYRDNPRTLESVLNILQEDIPGVAQAPVGFGAHRNLVLADDAADFGLKTGWIPPALEPAQLLMTGRSTWQQRLVVPEWQSERRPPRQQSFRTTPEVYRDLARLIPGNAEEAIFAATHPGEQLSRTASLATGGRLGSEERFSTTAKTSGKLTSPLWLEQYGQFLTGSVGSEVRRSLEVAETAAGGEHVNLSDLPVFRNFFARAKDAPQLWPVRRLFEVADEAKSYVKLRKERGEGLSAVERKQYEGLRKRVDAGETLDPKAEARYLALETKSIAPDPDDVLTMETYKEFLDRAQEVRELLSDWHDVRHLGDEQLLEELDRRIIDLSLQALGAHGQKTGRVETGRPGAGWAASAFKDPEEGWLDAFLRNLTGGE